MKTSVLLKVNLVLVPAMLLLYGGALWVLKNAAERTAFEETDQAARLIMAAAQATFEYTVEQVKPALEMKYDFLVQTVSAYAATSTIGHLQRDLPSFRFGYHVAALNPTNKLDLADDWERDAIAALARAAGPQQLSEIRAIDGQRVLYIAAPVRLKNPECLSCHSEPNKAPATMLAQYGRERGFGWKLNDVVAAQVVSVPVSVAQTRADALFGGVTRVLSAAFVIVLLTANAALYLVVARRIKPLTRAAEAVSMGHVDTAMPVIKGRDELADLEHAFERMRVSLSIAMQSGSKAAAVWPPAPAALARLKRQLAARVGPIAGPLVDRAAQRTASLEEFLQKLLANVPDRDGLHQMCQNFDFRS